MHNYSPFDNKPALNSSADLFAGIGNRELQVNAIGEFIVVPGEQLVATSGTISEANCYGAQLNNYGQATANADIALTLRAAGPNMKFSWVVGETVAKYYRFIPATGEVINLDGVPGVANKYCGYDTVAKLYRMDFYTIQTGAASWEWCANTVVGPSVKQS